MRRPAFRGTGRNQRTQVAGRKRGKLFRRAGLFRPETLCARSPYLGE